MPHYCSKPYCKLVNVNKPCIDISHNASTLFKYLNFNVLLIINNTSSNNILLIVNNTSSTYRSLIHVYQAFNMIINLVSNNISETDLVSFRLSSSANRALKAGPISSSSTRPWLTRFPTTSATSNNFDGMTRYGFFTFRVRCDWVATREKAGNLEEVVTAEKLIPEFSHIFLTVSCAPAFFASSRFQRAPDPGAAQRNRPL